MGGIISVGSFLAPEIVILFQNIGMLNADTGMLSAPGMLNIGTLNADFGMLSAPGMMNIFFFCEDNLLHIIFSFFANFMSIFLLFLTFYSDFLFFLRGTRGPAINLHLAEWCHWYAGASIRTVGRSQNWRALDWQNSQL